MTREIRRIAVSDLDRGLSESKTKPVGGYRTYWIMRMRREKSKCKLPRGFGKLSGKFV